FIARSLSCRRINCKRLSPPGFGDVNDRITLALDAGIAAPALAGPATAWRRRDTGSLATGSVPAHHGTPPATVGHGKSGCAGAAGAAADRTAGLAGPGP